jgi:hypothetical protein
MAAPDQKIAVTAVCPQLHDSGRPATTSFAFALVNLGGGIFIFVTVSVRIFDTPDETQAFAIFSSVMCLAMGHCHGPVAVPRKHLIRRGVTRAQIAGFLCGTF